MSSVLTSRSGCSPPHFVSGTVALVRLRPSPIWGYVSGRELPFPTAACAACFSFKLRLSRLCCSFCVLCIQKGCRAFWLLTRHQPEFRRHKERGNGQVYGTIGGEVVEGISFSGGTCSEAGCSLLFHRQTDSASARGSYIRRAGSRLRTRVLPSTATFHRAISSVETGRFAAKTTPLARRSPRP